MALLDIRHLCIEIKTPHGRVKMVDNINLTLNEGQICGLIGESGSGKSLVAKVICGVEKADWIISADRFRFNNVELLKLSPAKRRKLISQHISMIFQDPLNCLNPSERVGNQLMHTLTQFKGDWWRWFGWKRRRAIELLHRVGIRDHEDIMQSYPSDLTEGEAQKVMIAMAVANQPKLLVADEPTNSMDPNTQLQVFRLLMSMNKNLGTSILLLSNDIIHIQKWVGSFNIMYCGQTVEIAPKDELIKSPLHPYSHALLHSVPDFTQPLPTKSPLNTLRGNVPMLDEMPLGCRLGHRCPFSQKKCLNVPPLRKLKNREFACHYPLNFRENTTKRSELLEPVVISEQPLESYHED